jgi:hypothetical protein
MTKINPAKLEKALRGVDYPAHRNDLAEQAKANDASPEVLEFLEHIPDRTYGGPTGVAKEIKK